MLVSEIDADRHRVDFCSTNAFVSTISSVNVEATIHFFLYFFVILQLYRGYKIGKRCFLTIKKSYSLAKEIR